MQPILNARPARNNVRAAVLAILFLAGCAGGAGNSCGSSCGGAFVTKDVNGAPIVFSGQRLDNVAQLRVTQSGFAFLNADHLNNILTSLNGSTPALGIPCTHINTSPFPLNVCPVTEFDGVFIGDSNFDGSCTTADDTLAHITFKDATWGFDKADQILRMKLTAHIFTDPIYIRTDEAHSSLCSGNSPIQARVFYDDELNIPGTQQDTELDLDIKFTPSPDGRMELNVTDASLASIINRFDASHIGIDGFSNHATIPATGHYSHDACGSTGSNYATESSPGSLNCGGVLRVLSGTCDQSDPNPKGLCLIFQTVRDYLLNQLKNRFAPQIVNLLRGQIEKLRCQTSADSAGAAHACDNGAFRCPNDDNGVPLTCDTGRGVCVPQGQSPHDPGTGQTGTVPLSDGGTYVVGEHNCEPIPLGITGKLDPSALTDSVGFTPSPGLLVTMGLGSKTAAPTIDDTGVQLTVMAGTALPSGSPASLCVPPAVWANQGQPPALNFDDANNKPANVGTYEVGFSVASQMINRAMFDAYSASLFCVTLSNKTTPFISSGLFKTFLPSLGLVTGGRDVPMAVLLRPTQAPNVRIGRGTLKTLADGTTTPDDPLITVNFKQMNLDFYALVDERQVRVFTLQADLELPLGLRTFTGAQADMLQPVLGGLSTVLTNIKALNNEMLAEDPGVIRDLLGAAVQLAQPLLAGILKPIQLPSLLGLHLYVDGLGGAVPVSADLATDGYAHMAVYSSIAVCTPAAPCDQYTVKTQARIAATNVPASVDEVRTQHAVPSVEIEAGSLQARRGSPEFSYRIDGGLWSPWVSGPRFTVKNQIFLFQGHHSIDVTSREAGDDHTQDLEPVSLDFFVSFEAPSVDLYVRNDGAVVTRAQSSSTPTDKLAYSYRLGGQGGWTRQGPARVFTAEDLGGQSLTVNVTDEGGRATVAKYGADDAASRLAAGAVGCATSSTSTGPGALLAVLAGLLFLARRRRNS